MDPSSAPGPAAQTTQSDNRFSIAVAILMLLIVALVTTLWLRANRRALNAELQVQQLLVQDQKLQSMLQQLLLQKPPQFNIVRQTLPTRKATLDGRPVQALVLASDLGQMIGFEPGDVILVAEKPAAGPTSTASSAPAAPPADSQP